MKFLSLLLLFIITSCSVTPQPRPVDILGPQDVPTSIEIKPLETVVVPGGTQLETADIISTPQEAIKIEVVPGQHHQSGDFSVKSSLKVVKQLAELGNCLVLKERFYNEISNHKQFDYTSDNSEAVANKLADFVPVVLTTYKKRFSKSIAYRNVGSNVIYLNTLKLGTKPTKDRLNTIWHERTHVAGFGHGDNYKNGKENSVPYGTGEMSEKYFDECYAGLK